MSTDLAGNTSGSIWHTLLRSVGFLLGMVALATVMMGIIIAVARFMDRDAKVADRPVPQAPAAAQPATPPPEQLNARTRTPSPYAPEAWPSSPKYSRSDIGGKGIASTNSSQGNTARSSTTRSSGDVGLNPEEYSARTASGGQVYLPNPKGNCDMSGDTSPAALRTLDNCFAAQAGR